MNIMPQRFNSTSAPIFSGQAMSGEKIPANIPAPFDPMDALAARLRDRRVQVGRLEHRLAAVHAVVERYRLVSDSADAVCYVRDIERALGMDLPPVRDRDGRTDW